MRIACQALIAVTLAAGLSLPAQAAYLWAARTDDGAVSLRLGELSSPRADDDAGTLLAPRAFLADGKTLPLSRAGSGFAVEAGAFGEAAGSAGAELVFLRHGDDDFPKVLGQEALAARPHLSDDPEELAHPTWVHHRLARARRTLAEGRFDATPGGHCRWCAFASSCPAKSGQVIV